MNIGGTLKFCKHLGYRMLFQVKKKAPEICLIMAGATGIACVVSACKATVKAPEVLKEHNETLEKVKEIVKNEPESFGPKEERRMITKVYVKTAVKLSKLYAPAIVYGMSAGASVFGVYHFLNERNIALASALSIAERKLQLAQAKDILALPEGEKQEETEEKKDQEYEKPVANSLFDFFWGEGDKWWSDPRAYGPSVNPLVLAQAEEYFNKILPIRGAIFINDIRSYFDKNVIIAGQYAGWIYDPKKGDHQIDFGIHDPTNKQAIAFMNGDEPDGVWLRFNCESYILDKAMAKKQEMWDLWHTERKKFG